MAKFLSVTSTSPEETRILGASLGPVLLPGDVISLSGDLGAGKTVLVQGLAASLGVRGRVTSPSFTIVHEYKARYPILHIDVYRLNSFQEVIDLGFEELLDPGAVMVVEWGEAVAPMLPLRYLEIDMRQGESDDDRVLYFKPHGIEWAGKLEVMRSTAETLLDAASTDASVGARFAYALAPSPRAPGGEHPDVLED
jgi:tRNA threonylcarbamoyladenosine biosynthesis protein TsaE